MNNKTIEITVAGDATKGAPVPSKTKTRKIVICAGTGCVANGSLDVFREFEKVLEERGFRTLVGEATKEKDPGNGDGIRTDPDSNIRLSKSGCQGFCQMGPLVTIYPEEILYTKVVPGDVEEIVKETLESGRIVQRLLYVDPVSSRSCTGHHEIPFYQRQHRFVLKLCGEIDPESLQDYRNRDGYSRAEQAWLRMTPEDVCNEIEQANLRGRGGGGFPTGKKWHLARIEASTKKYVICNGDEGDPGAFMDRSIMEGNPHSVIEGIMIAARAIGANEAYVYVRHEYPLAVARIRKAVADAEEEGILGDGIFGTKESLTVHVMEGAGAFVCGEETALIASIEGKRGMPRPKPPFPSESGLWGKPTVINNVETLATVPLIIDMGATKFRRLGTHGSPGTKTFALSGHVANTGLIEVPFGITLREIIYDIGGGVTGANGKIDPNGFKAVQIGGPSGACLTAEHLDLKLDFDSIKEAGAMIGSGGLVVMNTSTCMVAIARYFMQFTQNESCGKCVLCREGTKQMLGLLDDIIEGRATLQTIELLEELASAVRIGSLCSLGKTAPNPVLSTLRQFRNEYEAHVIQKRCPAGECRALSKPVIDPAKCVGCTACARKCPVNAIHGERKQPHTIDPEICIGCGVCIETCKFNAIGRN